MVRNVKQLLKDLGWADGFNIPVANEENKQLEAKVESMIVKKAELIMQCEGINEHWLSLKNLLKKINNEKETNEIIINKLRQGLDSEMQVMTNSQDDQRALEAELRDLKRELSEKGQEIKTIQEELQIYVGKTKELRERLNWGDETLFAWEEDLARADRDFNFLKFYKIQDQNKFNELENRRNFAQIELNEAIEIEKKESDKLEYLECYYCQLCKDIRESEIERDNLMNMWLRVNHMIKSREDSIDQIFQKMDTTKSMLRQKLVVYMALESSYNAATNSDEFYKNQIKALDRERPYIEDQMEILNNAISKIELETEAAENLIRQLEIEFDAEKLKNAEHLKYVNSLNNKAKNTAEDNEKLKATIESVIIENMTAEQKCKTAEEIYEMGQKMLKEEQREIMRMETFIRKMEDEHIALKDKKKTTENELLELKAISKTKHEEIKKQSQLLKGLEESEYILELELLEISSKLEFLEGTPMDLERQNKLKEKVTEVKEAVKFKNKEVARLKNEIGNLKRELIILIKDLKTVEDDKKQLENKLLHCESAINGGKKVYLKAQEEHNKCTLKLNLIKMQINFTEENKKKHGLTVSVLERQKLHLQTAMQSRFAEIQANKVVLLSQKKSLIEEKAFLKRSIDHLTLKIKIYERRYQTAMDKLVSIQEDGEQMTIAQFRMKMGQQKAELQELGDDLEAKINKSEKEIEAMENTLRVVVSTNEHFKNNLASLDFEDEEVIIFNQLDSKNRSMNQANKQLKADIQNFNLRNQNLEQNLNKLREETNFAEQEWKQKEKEVLILTKDLSSKQIKLERATKLLQKISKEMRLKESVTRKIGMKDIEVRIEGERNKCVLQQLSELAAIYIETAPMVNKYLSEKGLTLPPIRESAFSIRTSSPEISETASRFSALSEISLTPSVVHLDPTLLLPEPYQKQKCKKY